MITKPKRVQRFEWTCPKCGIKDYDMKYHFMMWHRGTPFS
jgi:predicted nucleic-acid-binding Zn-ribbon protein